MKTLLALLPLCLMLFAAILAAFIADVAERRRGAKILRDRAERLRKRM